MSRLLMPQFARDIVEMNRRLVDSVQIDLAPSEQPEEAASQRRKGARAVRQLTRFTLNRKSDTREVWRAVLEIIEDGVATEEAKELVQIARTSIDSWLALALKTRDVWRGVEAETEATALDELAAAEAEVKQMLTAVETMNAFLSRPRLPIDLARLQKGQEEMAQGHVKKPEEMRSAFQRPQA